MQSGDPTVGGSNPLSAFTNAVPVVGVNPKIETVRLNTHCRKGTGGGKETIFEGFPSDSGGAAERLRKHRGTGQGAGSITATGLPVARCTGSGGARGEEGARRKRARRDPSRRGE